MIHEIPAKITEMFIELSRTYIQMTRDKINAGSDEEKTAVVSTIYHSLLQLCRIMAPLCPFITEKMYHNLKEHSGLENESVHDLDWPEADGSLINTELEIQFDMAKSMIQAILSAREKAQMGVRWPISEAIVVSTDEEAKKATELLADIIQKQTNVKKMTVVERFDKIKLSVKANYTKIGPDFGDKSPMIIAQMATTSPEAILSKIEKEGKFVLEVGGEPFELVKDHLIVKREVPELYAEGEFRSGYVYLDLHRTDELEAEGYARELMRRIQSQRKDAKLSKPDRISLFVQTDQEMAGMLKPWVDAIKEKVGATQINITHNEPAKMHEHKKKEKIKECEFVVEFDKV
jgi:isoleucyl-tRNA synthetase